MLTVYNKEKMIKKLKKRLLETLTSAKTARLPSGDHARKLLEIPEFDDDYPSDGQSLATFSVKISVKPPEYQHSMKLFRLLLLCAIKSTLTNAVFIK